MNSPTEEMMDQVDENDNIIGEVTKAEANNNPNLIHREVSVILFDDKNRILFQRRSLKKKVLPGFWGISCAGHVTKGLDPEAAAHKELKEELGFDVTLKFVEKRRLTLSNESRFMYVYLGKYAGQKIKVDFGETEEIKFMTEGEFDKTIEGGTKYAEISGELAKRFWSDSLK